MSIIKDLVKVIRKTAEERPDNAYLSDGTCYYSHGKCRDGTIGCLIAQTLPLVGIELKPEWDDLENEKGTGIKTILDDYFEEGDEIAYDWCDTVQCNQDCGMTWGEAVEEADKSLESEDDHDQD